MLPLKDISALNVHQVILSIVLLGIALGASSSETIIVPSHQHAHNQPFLCSKVE